MPLRSHQIGSVCIELQQVDSTNNYATALAHEGMAQHGTVVRSAVQTGGKGQRNRSWIAEPGANLTLSVLLDAQRWPGLPPFHLSKTVAVAIYQFFSEWAGDDTRIKWPNDLYWRDRKAGGILIENIYTGSTWKYAVVGIGININQADFGSLGTAAVSLRQVTGEQFDLDDAAQKLYAHLGAALDLMETDFAQVNAIYEAHLYKRHCHVRLKKDNRVFEAFIKGVSSSGELIVQHGVEERYAVGEVEWIIR